MYDPFSKKNFLSSRVIFWHTYMQYASRFTRMWSRSFLLSQYIFPLNVHKFINDFVERLGSCAYVSNHVSWIKNVYPMSQPMCVWLGSAQSSSLPWPHVYTFFQSDIFFFCCEDVALKRWASSMILFAANPGSTFSSGTWFDNGQLI